MTTHWTEAVLKAFPEAAIHQEPNEPVVVVIDIDSYTDIVFERWGPTGDSQEEGFTATLNEYARDHGLANEHVLGGGTSITEVISAVREAIEAEAEANRQLDALYAEWEAQAEAEYKGADW